MNRFIRVFVLASVVVRALSSSASDSDPNEDEDVMTEHLNEVFAVSARMLESCNTLIKNIQASCGDVEMDGGTAPEVCGHPFNEFQSEIRTLLQVIRPRDGDTYEVFLGNLVANFNTVHESIQNFLLELRSDQVYSARVMKPLTDPWATDMILLNTAISESVGAAAMTTVIRIAVHGEWEAPRQRCDGVARWALPAIILHVGIFIAIGAYFLIMYTF